MTALQQHQMAEIPKLYQSAPADTYTQVYNILTESPHSVT